MMNVQQNIKNSGVWLFGVLIVIFSIIFYLLCGIILLLVLFQFVTKLITGDVNQHVLKVSKDLTQYALKMLEYVTCQSEMRPFPFGSWADSTSTAQPKKSIKKPKKVTKA